MSTRTSWSKGFLQHKIELILQQNATRTDFAQRLQEIIDRYNSGGSATENSFEELVKFAEELHTEAERHIREGLQHSKLAVIDHNQAFETDFDPLRFAELHVFHDSLLAIFDDLADREIYRDRLAAAFAEFDPACDNVPSEWWTVDNGVPTRFNRDAVREFLRRFMNNDFWRVA